MKLKIPETLTIEHEALHARLGEATRLEGPLGEAARAVARILHPHFEREERIALPALGLLQVLAHGAVTPEMNEVVAMTEALKEELPRMLAEHQQIAGALRVFAEMAQTERRPECAELAKDLLLHARTEEEVLYPAAIVLGEYVKLRLGLPGIERRAS